ncbi:MAG: TonB-dependent receptor [Bryobacteraceae bacterium]|nr:TonB-dependent receptor [Bryobacteraceae bacterium]MDW8377875.1 TonB-dependent receptor [Bryobacterales bacterium]
MIRLFVVLVCATALLFAQADANRGQIVGTVLDANQAGVPGAKLRIKNLGTGFVREVTANETGQFRVLQLDAGTYEVVAEAQGFSPSTTSGIVVNVGSTVGLNIVMQVQAVSTTVEVAESLLNVAMPAPAAVVNSTAITNLPINGRRFQDFATLTPTVQVEPSRQQLSFAGQRGINANVMVDGADYNQPFFGGIRGGERSNFNFTIPQSAIQEFQVITTGYSAEYGRSTGGILNTITKSGTNEYHGEAFYQIRHRELSANNPILNRQPSETVSQFGGAAGGPIRSNRWFWFGALEQQLGNIPRQVFFAQLAGRTPTPQTQDALNFFRGEERNFKQTNRNIALTTRTDYQFQKGHRLTLRYNFQNSTEENAVSTGGALNPISNSALSNEGIEKNRNHFGTLQYTHLFSPNVINDLKFSGSYEIRPRLANSQTPSVNASPIGLFGARTFLPTTQDDHRWQITDGLSLTRGSHSVKLGLDFSLLSTFQTFGFNQFGSFVIQSSDVTRILQLLSVGPGQNRFDDRAPGINYFYDRQIGNTIADFGVRQLAFFAQDSWRVNSRLTLDYGLRWEGQWNPTPVTNNTEVLNRVNDFQFPIGARLRPTTIRDSLDQIMPRFGFAWNMNPTGRRTLVRGHAGIFYAATPMLLFSGPTNNLRLPPGDVSIRLTSSPTNTLYQQFLAVGVDLNRFPLGSLPVIPVETVQRAAALAAGGAAVDPFRGVNLTLMASDFRNPRAFQSGLGVEREITDRWLAGVQFNYVNTTQLHRNRDYNLPFPTIRPADGRAIFSGIPRPIPTLNLITVRESSARSMYRGVTLQSQYRSKKFQFMAFYTWSETFSDDDNERDAGGTLYNNSFDLRPEYHYSNLDARHQFTSSFVYTLPFGFEVGGIFRSRSGLPMNPRTGADTNGDASANDRPYSAPGVVFKRNSFRNRGVVNNDLRILKNFRLGNDVRRLQLSAEMFNLFNIDNVTFNANGAIYGLGIGTNGQPVAVDPRFQSLRRPDGSYDPNTTQQVGNPFQLQLGIRFFF